MNKTKHSPRCGSFIGADLQVASYYVAEQVICRSFWESIEYIKRRDD
jgi:hypothetical protein